MLNNPKALDAAKAEGAQVRARKVWDYSTVMEREVLCSQADKQGERFHVADAMTIAGVRNPTFLPANTYTRVELSTVKMP